MPNRRSPRIRGRTRRHAGGRAKAAWQRSAECAEKTEAFAMEADFDATCISSNLFEIEWPPRSGRMQSFPEIDRAAWFALPMARQKILPGQQALLDRLEALFRPNGGVN